MKLTRLTPELFEQSISGIGMSGQTLKIARAVLVDGRSQVDVAKEYLVTKQCVNNAVTTIKRAYFEKTTPGEGFIRVELDLPEVFALELSELSQALMRGRDAKQISASIQKLLSVSRSERKQLDLSKSAV